MLKSIFIFRTLTPTEGDDWMAENCKQTCDLCPPTSSLGWGCSATDYDVNCCDYVKQYSCDKMFDDGWMVSEKCEISCGKCGKNDHCKEPEKFVCEDTGYPESWCILCKKEVKDKNYEDVENCLDYCLKSYGNCPL